MGQPFYRKFLAWFGVSKNQTSAFAEMDPKDVPAQYWPETQHFLDNLKAIVKENTIDDPQAKRMNAEIIAYVEKQIAKKAYSGTYHQKCQALEMIADRVLSTSINKLVGQKEQTTQTTAFSDCIKHFKEDIERKEKELSQR